MVFNTNTKLANYLNISTFEASHILAVKKEYDAIMEKYNIECIEDSEFIIPQRYFDEGFKLIDVPGPIKYVANKDGIIINTANDMEIGKRTNGYDGYIDVNLNGRIYRLHRIIATLFIPNPNNYPMVNHKNEIKSDNRACNLEWCTNSYNMSYGSMKTIWTKPGEKTKPKKIKCVKDNQEWILPSVHAASRFTGVGGKSIRLCLQGKLKQGKGFSFFLLE